MVIINYLSGEMSTTFDLEHAIFIGVTAIVFGCLYYAGTRND